MLIVKVGDAYSVLWVNKNDETRQAAFNDFKRRVFDCKEIKHNKYGRVCELVFEERKIDYNEGF